jgi:F-type H+-transporting ATPase subunit delta
MSSMRAAKRYARALIELAVEQNQLEPWGAELARLASTLGAPEVSSLLSSPEIPQQARVQAVSTIAERLNLSFPLRSFAMVVARHGRIDEIAAISDSYQAQLDDYLRRARATLTFAQGPQDDDVNRVVGALENISGKKVIPTVRVDPALLGGVVAELEGKTYDASLATRLEAARRRLSE